MMWSVLTGAGREGSMEAGRWSSEAMTGILPDNMPGGTSDDARLMSVGTKGETKRDNITMNLSTRS